ncbi:MAG: tripartite tricarboxylate transporter substrate binding protein [Burkholderiales bacterium]|nr:tripartite tricarboxylate transporter substrate binding protein [Burkholderiales bacterium]
MSIRSFVCALVALWLPLQASQAQEWPDRPIKMVVAWPAGGGTDIVARIVAKHLGERLKQPVVVDNRAGASGVVGTEYVSRAKPDGYTVQYTVADSHSINPHVFSGIRYDAINQFTPVSIVGSMPNSLIVNPKVPAKTVEEFIQLAKENPGKYTYASWGVGSGGHIRMEALNSFAKTKTLHVPYQGSGPALTAVIAGEVDAMMAPYGLAEATARAGKVRMLSVDTSERLPEAPQIPTLAEQGVPLRLAFWQGLLVPAKTPEAIINRLNTEMSALLADPQVRAELRKAGVAVNSMGTSTLADIRGFFDSEYERWGTLIREVNISAKQ